MTLIEQLYVYCERKASSGADRLQLNNVSVGSEIMTELAADILTISGVDLGSCPEKIKYKGILIQRVDGLGMRRIDAKWEDICIQGKLLRFTERKEAA